VKKYKYATTLSVRFLGRHQIAVLQQSALSPYTMNFASLHNLFTATQRN